MRAHEFLREDVENFPIANVRRPNGAIGNQGVNTEQAADVLTHAAGMQVSPDMSMRQLVDALRADPAAQQRLRQFVQKNPITVYALPDGSYHLQDGHHRTFLLNLLGDETVPAVVKEGVMEGESNAMVNTASRLANKDDGKVAKLRAAGDKRREDQLKGRDIARRDRTSKDEWGYLKQGVTEGSLTEIDRMPGNEYSGGKKSLRIGAGDKNIRKLPGNNAFMYSTEANHMEDGIIIKLWDSANTTSKPVQMRDEDGEEFAWRLRDWERNQSEDGPGVLIGKLVLEDVPTFPLKGALQVDTITVDEDYRGQGVAKSMYGVALSILRRPLLAGRSQTPGGRRNWLSLATTPGIEIKGYVMINQARFDNPEWADKDIDVIMGRLGGQYIGPSRPPGIHYFAFDVVPGSGELAPAVRTELSKIYNEHGSRTGLYAIWSGAVNEQGVAEGKQPGQPVVDAILKVMPIAQEIWFHGSRATRSHRKNSDTDILVIVPDDLVGDQYLGAVRILQKLSTHFDNHDIQPTKAETNIHRIAQEEGRLLWSNKQGVTENFADGKGPGRPGDSQRHGIPKHATMAELEKASHADGRKGQLARWQLNMRRGHKK